MPQNAQLCSRDGGARLKTASSSWLPQIFDLEDVFSGVRRAVARVWSRHHAIGVRSEQALANVTLPGVGAPLGGCAPRLVIASTSVPVQAAFHSPHLRIAKCRKRRANDWQVPKCDAASNIVVEALRARDETSKETIPVLQFLSDQCRTILP